MKIQTRQQVRQEAHRLACRPVARRHVLLQVLGEDHHEAAGDGERRRPVDEDRAAARAEPCRRRRARMKFCEERQAERRTRSARARRTRPRRTPRSARATRVGASRAYAWYSIGEEDERERRREHDAALEAAAGRDEAVRDDVQPEQEADGSPRRAPSPRTASLRTASTIVASSSRVARLAQEQRDARRGGEEDQLLAHRVEAAVVEDDRGDGVRHVPLGLGLAWR